MEDFVILGTYEGTVDDVEKAFGEETANRMMWEIFTYGATGKREQEFPKSVNNGLLAKERINLRTLPQSKVKK